LQYAPATGDTLWAFSGYPSYHTLTPGLGDWNGLDNPTVNNAGGQTWERLVLASDPTTYTFSQSGGSSTWTLEILELAGMSTSAPFFQHASNAQASATVPQWPSLTPVAGTTLSLAALSTNGGQTYNPLTPSAFAQVDTIVTPPYHTQAIFAYPSPAANTALAPFTSITTDDVVTVQDIAYPAGAATPGPTPTPTPTPSPTPTPTPTPTPVPTATAIYSAYTPYPGASQSPIPFTLPTTPAQITVMAAVNCTANTNGQTAVSVKSAWALEIGACNGGTNTGASTSLKFYTAGGSPAYQAYPSLDLSPGTYLLAGTYNGASINLYVCSIGAGASCTPSTASNTVTLAQLEAGCIGASTTTTCTAANAIRLSSADIWDMRVYSGTPLSQTAITAIAAAESPDPYATSTTPAINTPYSSANNNYPPGGSYPYYPLSPLKVQLPATTATVPPSVSATWAAYNSQSTGEVLNPNGVFRDITARETTTEGSNDSSDPTYYASLNDNSQATWISCAVQVSSGLVGYNLCPTAYSACTGNCYPANTVNSYSPYLSGTVGGTACGPTSGWKGCPVANLVEVPSGAQTATDTDCHSNFIETNLPLTTPILNTSNFYTTITGYEFDLWAASVQCKTSGQYATLPTSPNTYSTAFLVGSEGACDLSLDGSGCGVAYAGGTAGSLGLINPKDILACLNETNVTPGSLNDHCTMPFALAIAVKCTAGFLPHSYNRTDKQNNILIIQYPVTHSDYQCQDWSAGSPPATAWYGYPYGARGYLPLHDSDINSSSIPNYLKVLERTIDADHYGLFVRDASDPGEGYAFWQYQGAEAYPAGTGNPWVQVAQNALNEGKTYGLTQTQINSGIFKLPMGQGSSYSSGTNPSIQLKNLVWCLNSKNDGLCD
jgi:hypothetical protein